MIKKRLRIAYLVSHPIQYQAPLLAELSNNQNIDLITLFRSNFSVSQFYDEEFKQNLQWDTPLLSGYAYKFLPTLGNNKKMNFWSPINYGLLHFLYQNKIQVLWIHGWGSFYLVYAILVAKLVGVRVLIRGESSLHLSSSNRIKNFIKAHILRMLFRMIDVFLSIGKLNEKFYKEHDVENKRIIHMPYAVDNKYFQEEARKVSVKRSSLKEKMGIKEGCLVILYASKMTRRKRADDLLHAYASLIKVIDSQEMPYLIYIGDGECYVELKNLAISLDLKNIIFLGFKNQSELAPYFDLCDVFVLPSENEPWGLVINEVMNFSKPIIATDQVGCAPDLIRHGENGFIYSVGDIFALGDYLRRFALNPGLSEAMGKLSLSIINQYSFEADIAGMDEAAKLITYHGTI
jgi:glycosyltransferase involved in cell wall biosynthesis